MTLNAIANRVLGFSKTLKPYKNLLTKDAVQLRPRQPLRNAFMDAVTEAELGPGNAVDVKLVRIFEDRLISVGGLVRADHPVACLDHLNEGGEETLITILTQTRLI